MTTYKKKIYLFYFFIAIESLKGYSPDLTLMGRVIEADGLGKHPISFYNMLKTFCNINIITLNQDNIPEDIAKVRVFNNQDIGQVLLYCDALKYNNFNPCENLPRAKINIAYSVFETSKISAEWVSILNNKFDMVVVADTFLTDVYKKSGVNIPIFVLPLAIDIDKFLELPIKNSKNPIFTFGTSASFSEHKNHEKVLDAFIKSFGNNPQVRLIIHGKWGNQELVDQLNNKIKKANISNVTIIQKVFNQDEYLAFMQQLDCYILASKGEGFSITPREACALGIPCILSNNTAHSTICKNHFINSFESNIIVKPPYENLFGTEDIGYQFDCKTDNISSSLVYVYNNYEKYLALSEKARKWASLYSYKSLTPYYQTLIKPEKVVLGISNNIQKNCIITNSIDLYNKYTKISYNQ